MDNSDNEQPTTPPSRISNSSPVETSEYDGSERVDGDIAYDPTATAYHRRLGVSLNPTSSQVRNAGKAASNLFHPDNDTKYANEDFFMNISEARKILSDTEKRSAYQTFCANFGVVEGTKRFESWRSRGEPRSAEATIKQQIRQTSFDYRECQDVTEYMPLPDVRGEKSHPDGSNQPTETSSDEPIAKDNADSDQPPTQSPHTNDAIGDSKINKEDSSGKDKTHSDGDFSPLEDSTPNLHTSGSGVPDISAGSNHTDYMLSGYTPKIVTSTEDFEDLSVLNNTYSGVDYVEIRGFIPTEVLLFNLPKRTVSTYSQESITGLSWSKRVGTNEYVFKFKQKEIVIELVEDQEPSVSSNSKTDSDSVADDENTDSEYSYLNQSPEGVGDLLANVIRYLWHTASIKMVVLRVVAGSVWFGIVLSEFITLFGSVFLTLSLIPLQKTGVYILSVYTLYYIVFISIFGYTLPTGNMPFSLVLFSLISSCVSWVIFSSDQELIKVWDKE